MRVESLSAGILEPDLDAGYTLGMTYLRLKDIQRAKLLFEEMQTALGNSAMSHVLFGRAYEETGFPAEAEREFRQALAIDNKTPRAHFYLGYVILQHGASERLPEAREEFEQEVQLDPQSVYSNFFLGVLASTAGEHAKAIRYLEETTRLNPTLARPICFWDSLKPKWVMPELKRVCAAQSSWLSTSLITASKSRRLTSLLGACC